MIRVYKIVALLVVGFTFMACPADDSPSSEPLRDYQEVYVEELVEIENFLDTHYVTVDADFNTTFTDIPDVGTQTPISEMPELTHIPVTLNDVDYKVYYLRLNEGNNENPTALDSVYSSYKGQLLDKTVFDHASTPIWFKLEEVIPAWGKIFPLFKTGDFVENTSTGIVSYSGYGAGVMFVEMMLAVFALIIAGTIYASPAEYGTARRFHRPSGLSFAGSFPALRPIRPSHWNRRPTRYARAALQNTAPGAAALADSGT